MAPRLQTYPLSLTARFSIAANQTVEPTTTQLQNPSGEPFLVDEIRIKTQTSTPSSDNSPFDTHFAVGMSLRLGRTALTNGFVPIGNFGRVPFASIDSAQTQEGCTLNSIWRLWKPLLLRPGEFLIPTFCFDRNYGTPGNADPIQMSVTYAGRRIIDPNFVYPQKIIAPWVSAFRLSPQVSSPASGLVQDASKETDLVNMCDEPIFVQRFIGRWSQLLVSGPGSLSGQSELPSNRNLIATAFTTVKAIDSLGTILVRDPTPWTQVFRFSDRSWDVHTFLDPKRFYLFTVDRDFTNTLSGFTQYTESGAISMVGYREIAA